MFFGDPIERDVAHPYCVDGRLPRRLTDPPRAVPAPRRCLKSGSRVHSTLDEPVLRDILTGRSVRCTASFRFRKHSTNIRLIGFPRSSSCLP
jgi:hypothetical protein